MNARRNTALLAAVCALTACGNDLDVTPQKVHDLRILAICADTPETFVASVGLGGVPGLSGWPYVITATPPPVTVRALVVDPRKVMPVFDYRVHACLGGNGAPRCDAEAEGTELLVDTTPGGPGELNFTVQPTSAMLNTWLEQDAYRGYGSLYVMLHLTLTAPDGETLEATKILTYTHPGVTPAEGQDPPPPPVPNTNPAAWTLTGKDDGPVLTSADVDPVVTLAPGAKWETDITLEGADPEYAVPRFPTRAGEIPGYELLEEQLFLDFYSTAGEWAQGGVTNRNVFGDVEKIEATFRAPKAGATRPTLLYLVSSDDRGGCAWRTARVVVDEATR